MKITYSNTIPVTVVPAPGGSTSGGSSTPEDGVRLEPALDHRYDNVDSYDTMEDLLNKAKRTEDTLYIVGDGEDKKLFFYDASTDQFIPTDTPAATTEEVRNLLSSIFSD